MDNKIKNEWLNEENIWKSKTTKRITSNLQLYVIWVWALIPILLCSLLALLYSKGLVK